MVLRFSIARKLVLAFLGLSIVPLCFLGVSTLHNLRAIGQRAIDSSTAQLEQRARESLELRAIELADRVSQTLHSSESDLFILKMIPRDAHAYRQFSLNHRKSIWTREGTNRKPVEVRRELPLYREVAFIDATGNETLRIFDDHIVGTAELRDVSNPTNTTYKSERYFEEALKLKDGEVYVSHVTGWYVTREEQLQGETRLEDAVEGRKYEGVVRFATPCFDEAGRLEGIVMLSLDHRHVMEFTMHILPTEGRFVAFPSYSSGSYAFMFDDEGWIISHPKYYDIRGVLPDGREFDPSDPVSYTRERLLAGHVPFNLDYVNFINPNYPFIANEIRAGRSGVTNTFNVGGTPRVMAYAPIVYNRPSYDRHGVFGGITIGVELAKFEEPALLAGAKIDEMVSQTKLDSLVILGLTALVAVSLGVFLSRTFTRPILYLARKARDIGSGDIPDKVAVHTGDELELLADNFAQMAKEIRDHQDSLEQSLVELSRSKKSAEKYSLELEKQLRVLNTVHYLSQYLTSVYDRELVLETVLRTSVEGLGYDRAILYLYDRATRRLVCHKTYGFSPELERKAMDAAYDVDRHDCIPTLAFRTGETIFVKDVRGDPRATPLDLKIAQAGETDRFVISPLKSRDRVIGLLGADTKTSRREISETDVESLQIIANDAARAIERSKGYSRFVAERNFIESIVNHVMSGIITLDESGRVTWFNPYSENVFGKRREDVLGTHYRQAFSGIPSWVEAIDHCLASDDDGELSQEHHTVLLDGREKVLEVQFSIIRQEKGNEDTFLLLLRDVTERKRLEEHIRRSDRLVSLGVLAAGIAHEMRNPLTGISLLLDDLHDHLCDMPQERGLIQRSLQEIERLEDLIQGLLDFAVPSKSVSLELHPIGDVLQNTVFLVRKLCKNQNISLSVDTEEPLPPIHLDPEKLKQAILNLMLNAIQAMPEGGSLQLRAKMAPIDESLISRPAIRIIVADTGIGISPENISYIFDPFFSRNPKGCGLGLAIVHSIVEEHKGRIAVFSQPDKGTVFWIDLPAAEAI